MNKIVLSITILMIMSITTYAEDVNKQGDTFLKTIDGYIRLGYQKDDNNKQDLALGGKLHIETNNWHRISAGASFYTTNHLGEHDGATVPFFDANNNSYSLLGEAYIQGKWENTTLIVGR